MEDERAGPRLGLARDEGGAVYVEFLIAFLPVYVFFLCLIQLTIIFSVRLVTEHAALHAARAAAVVIGDQDSRYGGEQKNKMVENGKRYQMVRNAALLTLTPLLLNGLIQSVQVVFPEPGQPNGPAQTGTLSFSPMNGENVAKVRVRVEVEAACRIGLANQIACPNWTSFLRPDVSRRITSFLMPTQWVRAEAVYPYQGARYDYQ